MATYPPHAWPPSHSTTVTPSDDQPDGEHDDYDQPDADEPVPEDYYDPGFQMDPGDDDVEHGYVTIEESYDNGATWETLEDHEPIPIEPPADDNSESHDSE